MTGLALMLAGLGLGAAPPPVGAPAPRPDVRCGSFCLFVALQALEWKKIR